MGHGATGIAEIHRFPVWRANETVIVLTVAFAAVYFACVATFDLETVPQRRAAVVRSGQPLLYAVFQRRFVGSNPCRGAPSSALMNGFQDGYAETAIN